MPEFRESDILYMHMLSGLVLSAEPAAPIEGIEKWDEFWATADAHHVLVRSGLALKRFAGAQSSGTDDVVDIEQARIVAVFDRLPAILSEFEAADIGVVVIKSLDHWPDFGSDIDLFTDAPESVVSTMMRNRFEAEVVPPTLGDRLANKVNFRVPGLAELVEVHYGRLGQTGEHVELARRVLDRRRVECFNGSYVPVPAPEERLILATLQRMYRHFYIRICDIANAARIVQSGELDFDELRHASKRAGIWPGVATYLKLVSQYVEHYRGDRLKLPFRVYSAARFGLKKLYPHAGFLRLPLFPQAVSLYTRQLSKSVRRDAAASLRLSLLPPLAAAAGAKYRLTGSDKGVW
ncbi:MAG TPA: hypothetical protein VFU86_08840 [Terriglobales bacterium]|nr:hypothetical protein [Terriglobales bacterium]